jgi:peptidyl-dipeptidase Dcp
MSSFTATTALPEELANNPLLQEWQTPFGVPPFHLIQPQHFESALQYAMKQHLEEVTIMAANPETPSFANIIAPFDRSGSLLSKVCDTFENLCSSNGVPELQAIELKMASPLAAHSNAVMTIPGLFAKIDAVHEARHSSELALNEEQIRLVERYHLDFVRSGARFTKEMQERYGKIVEELAELSTKFTQVSYIHLWDIFGCVFSHISPAFSLSLLFSLSVCLNLPIECHG